MDQKHQNHLNSILETFNKMATAKYEKGQAEHGGNLWEKPGLLDEAINEAIDQVVYLVTLRQQMHKKNGI